jgi:uncharacterized protein
MQLERRNPITPRRVDFPFDDSIPRHWFGGNPLATHVANGLNLLFPAGERYFVRSVKRYLSRIDDPKLREEIRGFFGQEGRHANEHERFFRILEAQGYEIRTFLDRYESFAYGFLERVLPASINLAGTAAAEHFTATLAELALREGLLEAAHPTMRALLLWHASEEIEHKAVAYDVLQKFHPSYAVRVTGLFVASVCLVGFWVGASRSLIAQDELTRADRKRARAEIGQRRVVRRTLIRGIRDYLRRDFHPWQNDNLHLAKDYLASLSSAVKAAA